MQPQAKLHFPFFGPRKLSTYRHILFLVLGLTGLMLFWSKNNNHSEQPQLASASVESKEPKVAPQPVDELHILYINNYADNEELKALFLQKKNVKKLDCQALRDAEGYLGLLLVPAKKEKKQYWPEDARRTNRLSVVQTSALPNEELIVGDVQVADRIKETIRLLYENIYEPGDNSDYKYILFVPYILTETVTQNGRTFTGKYLEYQIVASNELPVAPLPQFGDNDIGHKNDITQAGNGALPLTLTVTYLGGAYNPSPPRKVE